jgi:hypothetical protein
VGYLTKLKLVHCILDCEGLYFTRSGQTLKTIINIFRILWASPYTLIGLCIGFVGLIFGSRVRRKGRAIEFYDGGVKWFMHQLPFGQFSLVLTLGHVILGQTEAALEISRTHETVYIYQYERWGPFTVPAYYLASIYVWLLGKRFYRDNPFEREAIEEDRSEYLTRVSLR